MRQYWCVIPAAGSGRRFGGERPKQYADLLGEPMIVRTMRRLAAHPAIAGLMVLLSPGDPYWPGTTAIGDVRVLTTPGGRERSDSVRAGLAALPSGVAPNDWVLVHDAARPCVPLVDITRLLEIGTRDAVGAILAAPVRDTMKATDSSGRITNTVPRENLWRALTPQLCRRGELLAALDAAHAQNDSGASAITDDANALELSGNYPILVEGSSDNLKVTSASDLSLAAWILTQQGEPG
jgi:2-C-methyl-D-erythritol 4-phosphate cytidylyltransferase